MANVLDFASDLGKALYHCGAETYRIEETVKRVLLALTEPNTEVDVFAIPAYLAISVKLPDEEGEPRIHKQEDGTEALSVEAKEGHVLYRSLRMSGVSYNLENLEKINDLSRRITAHKIGLDDAYKELEEITVVKEKPWWQAPLSYGCIGMGFALIFGAPWSVLPFPFLIGVTLYYVLQPFHKRDLIQTLTNTIGAFYVTFMTWLFAHFGLLQGAADSVNVGVIMILVPGMLLTNGARDLMAKDTVSGLSNLTEACMAALALALGSGLALYFWRWIGRL